MKSRPRLPLLSICILAAFVVRLFFVIVRVAYNIEGNYGRFAPVALRRMLSRVPNPIALRRVQWYWFRFGHTPVWVWALCWVVILWHGEPPLAQSTSKTRQNIGPRPNPISRTREATPKRGSPYPQLEGPRQSVGFHIPNLRSHAKAYPQLEGPRQSVGVRIPNSRGHAKTWKREQER